jgi:hypothetical protein
VHLVIDLFHPGVSLLVQVRQRGEGDPRPEVLLDETDGRLNLALRFRPVRTAYTGHEAVVGGELEELLVEMQLAAFLVEQHGLHAVGEQAFGHPAEISKAVYHPGQQVMDVLALRELDVAHARVA